MKLLVTGGAGFIGSNFIRYWLKNYSGDTVVNFDKLTYAGNLENLEDVENDRRYLFVKGDITDGEVVDGVMRGVDWIVHFAAESHVDRSILDPSIFVKTNVLGTYILLDYALKHNVKRFHHVSTDEVFGTLDLNDDKAFNEQTTYAPRSPYAATKASSDHLVRSFYATYGLQISITNCSDNFGPFQFPEKFIPLAITNVLEGKKIPIYGDGLYVRDWLYVEDHCRAIDFVLQKGKIGETYCVGGLTEDINNLQVARKILKILGYDESYIEFVKDRPGHDRRYAINWTKIKTELGWLPRHDFDTRLAETIKWYQTHKDWWKKIKSGEYRKYYAQQYGHG